MEKEIPMIERKTHPKGQHGFECFVHSSHFVYITQKRFLCPKGETNKHGSRFGKHLKQKTACNRPSECPACKVYLLLQLHVVVVDDRRAFGPVHHRPLQTESIYRKDNESASRLRPAHLNNTQVQILVSINAKNCDLTDCQQNLILPPIN